MVQDTLRHGFRTAGVLGAQPSFIGSAWAFLSRSGRLRSNPQP